MPRSSYSYKKNTRSLKITIISHGSIRQSFLRFILPDAKESSFRFTIKNIDANYSLSISKNTMPFKYLLEFPILEDSMKIHPIDLLNDADFDSTKFETPIQTKNQSSQRSGEIADDEEEY